MSLLRADRQRELVCLPAFPMESVRVRKVMDTIRLNVQLVEVEREVPKLRAHNGYISELIVHGIGPIPTPANTLDAVKRVTST